MSQTSTDPGARSAQGPASPAAKRAFRFLTGGRGAVDSVEARSGLRHTASLTLTKLGDGLFDPKLVLAFLLSQLGAPAVFAASMSPLREAGSLLPQVLLAGPVESMRHAKWAWVLGAAVQGLAVAAVALAAMSLEGAAAGWAIGTAVAVFAVARALSSVSYKEILGRTVAKTRRGAVTGFAASAAGVGVILFALLMMTGLLATRTALVGALVLAALFWAGAAALFATLEEPAHEAGRRAKRFDLAPLRDDPQLRRFILTRGLLVSTALAPPYFVLLAGGEGGTLGRLGAMVMASALAALLSSWVWGRASDRSSRRVLMATGLVGAAAMLAALGIAALGLAGTVWAIPAALFVLMIAYQGVRQGRSTYLVDMAPEGHRATYAATANTAIGAILVAVGALGGALAAVSPLIVLAVFAAMAGAGAVAALTLDEVEAHGERAGDAPGCGAGGGG